MGRAQGVPIVAIDPDIVKATLGERLRLRRRALKIPQTRLARLIGVTAAQVRKYEYGQDELRVPAMLALCAALDLSAFDLIAGLRPTPLSTTARYAPPKKPKAERASSSTKSARNGRGPNTAARRMHKKADVLPGSKR